MQMATLDVPKEQARAAFLDYRAAVRARHNAEDELLMNAYRQVASGKQVIDLFETMKAGGLDADGRPKLAIGRANMRMVYLQRYAARDVTFCNMQNKLPPRGPYAPIRLPVSIFGPTTNRPHRAADGQTWWSRDHIDAKALTPSIPPWARPRFKLERYHILWEAVWEPSPPVDPALLKHIGGPLYVVLATWDLTPLERSVLSLRLLEKS